MASNRPTTPQSSKSATAESLDLEPTHSDKMDQGVAAKTSPSKPDHPQPKQSGATTVLILVSVLLAVFLVALDRTIISTAIPQITDEFNSFTDVGWYGSAYLLTFCALQLLYGRLYTFFSINRILLTSILLFEVASALCGAAPNSIAFIIGRAIAGVGAAGIMGGSIVCIAFVVPLEKRPMIQGMFGGLMGVASIAGPLIGGGFTSNITWRWCFYINLPIGGVAMLVIFFLLNVPNHPDAVNLSLTKKLMRLDALGTSLLAPGVASLLLALQWGGQTYTWSNGRIIALLTLTGVLLIAFAAVQILLPTTATLPPRIFKQRTVVAALWSTLCINCGNYIVVYFLPIWFQSIKGVSAAESGIRTLPLMLSMVAASITGGIANSKIGYYTPLAIVGSCIMTVGVGLFTTFQVDTSEGKWIGYQILYGIGLGLCFQVPNLAVQVALPKKDVPTGLTLMLFSSLLGASVFVAVGENVLANQLVKRLSGVPGVDPDLITSTGATSLLDSLPDHVRETGQIAYNESLRKVFQVGLIPSCLSVLGAASLEWKSVKKPQAPVTTEEKSS